VLFVGRLRTSREPVERCELAIGILLAHDHLHLELELPRQKVVGRTLDNVQIGVSLAIGILVAAHAGIALKVNKGTINHTKVISNPYNKISHL
jgi:hypothetical protein